MVSIVRTGEVMTGQYCEAWQSYNYYDSHQPWQPWGGQAWPGDLESYFTNTTNVQQLMVNVENKSPVQEVPCLPSPLTESESGYSSYSSHASGDTYEEQQQYPGQVSPPSSPGSKQSSSPPSKPPTPTLPPADAHAHRPIQINTWARSAPSLVQIMSIR